MYTQPGIDLQSILPQLLLASIAQSSQPAVGQGKGIFEDLGRNLIPPILDALRDSLSKSLAGQQTWGMAGGLPGGQERFAGFPFTGQTFPSPFPPPFLDVLREAVSKSLGGQQAYGMAGGQERFLGSLLPLLGPVLIPHIVDTLREAVSKSLTGQPTWGMAGGLPGGMPGGQERFVGSLLPILGPVLIPHIVDAVRDSLSKSLAGQQTWGMGGGQGKDIFGDMGRALGSVLIPSLVDAVRDAISKSPGMGSERGH